MRHHIHLFAVLLLSALSACRTVHFGDAVAKAGPPVRAEIELEDPFMIRRTALTEAGLHQHGCRFELTDRERIKQLRARVFEGLAAFPGQPTTHFEIMNKLVFVFDDGRVETLLFSRAYRNIDRLPAEWEGMRAEVAHSLPAQVVKLVNELNLPQLNPGADNAYRAANRPGPVEWACLHADD